VTNQQTKLGIIDWGIGAISIVKLLAEQKSRFPIVYLSDTGVTPYGRMSRDEIIVRLNSVIKFLGLKGVTHIVIGCNAASTAIKFLNANDVKIAGMIDSAVSLTAKLNPTKLAVIGGRRTILSGIYRKEFSKRGIKIKQRIAQPLSALIESGDISSPTLRRGARKILAPIKNSSHVLLACTHYPAIAAVLSDYVSPETKFIDPVNELISKICEWKLSESGKNEFCTTGDIESMKNSAEKAFGYSISTVEKVKI
jgi:glutamate racemase